MVTRKSNILKRIGKFKSKQMMEMAMQEAVTKQHFSTEHLNSHQHNEAKICLTTKQKGKKPKTLLLDSSMLK